MFQFICEQYDRKKVGSNEPTFNNALHTLFNDFSYLVFCDDFVATVHNECAVDDIIYHIFCCAKL